MASNRQAVIEVRWLESMDYKLSHGLPARYVVRLKIEGQEAESFLFNGRHNAEVAFDVLKGRYVPTDECAGSLTLKELARGRILDSTGWA